LKRCPRSSALYEDHLSKDQRHHRDEAYQRYTCVDGEHDHRWVALGLVQKRRVDQFDVDATVLHCLDRVGDLDQLAGGFFRVIFFIPFAVPAVVASVMWSFLLEPQFGPFTHLANVLGFANTNFLGPNLIFPVLIVIVIWEWTGYNMVILYTALKSVPRELIEAAVLDRTPMWKIVLKVKLPMVRPAIVLLAFLNVIGALQLFTEPIILAYYAPESISNYYTPVLYLYNTAIGGQQYNLAAAGAVLFGIIIVVLSVGSLIIRRRRGEFG